MASIEPRRNAKTEFRCVWCLKRGVRPSDWEQKSLHGMWQRMCNRCATKRLNNPWNALLGMRRVDGQH